MVKKCVVAIYSFLFSFLIFTGLTFKGEILVLDFYISDVFIITSFFF